MFVPYMYTHESLVENLVKRVRAKKTILEKGISKTLPETQTYSFLYTYCTPPPGPHTFAAKNPKGCGGGDKILKGVHYFGFQCIWMS
jgi:hypothetical protein